PQRDPRHERGRRPDLLRRAGRQPAGRLAHPAGGEPQRVPGVAQPYGPAQRRVAVAADPERDVPAPVVRLVLPRGPDREQVLVGEPAAVAERDAERAELLPGPADA